MTQADKALHQQRNRYRLTTEEAGALLAYRSLPHIARRRLCSLMLRVLAGMDAGEVARLYYLEGMSAEVPLLRTRPRSRSRPTLYQAFRPA